MKTIISKLENNIFSGILVKKGTNKIFDKDYNVLLLDVNFCTFTGLGLIKVEGAISAKVKKAVAEVIEEVKKSFDDMTYQELLKYVKKHNIKVPSTKKADILKVLKEG